MRGDLSPLYLSVLALAKMSFGDVELIDEDVIDDVTTVFVFRLVGTKNTLTVSVGIEQVHFIET